MGRVTSHYKYFCILYTKHGKVFYKKSFLHKGGYFCIIRQILTRKRAKSLISHIMKSYETIMKSYIVCNITHIVYNNGGNLCKYAYHLLYINATFIRFIQSIATHIRSNTTFIHKYSKNIPFFVQFLYVFVPKLAKNCTKLTIFVPKLYKN